MRNHTGFLQAIIFSFFLFIAQFSVKGQNNPATADTTIGLGSFNGIMGYVRTIKTQTDGKILVGGEFTYYKTIPSKYLIRFNADGSVDNTFNVGNLLDDAVYSIVIQPDGKILVGGIFPLVRLNSDGSVDNTFQRGSSYIYSLALQADGKILVGGNNIFVRLNYDGSLDNTFNINSGFNSDVMSLAIQTDGKIIAGGGGTFNGSPQNGLIRLNSDGSVDNSFSVITAVGSLIFSIAIQTDGKLVVGGEFESINNVSLINYARLNTDGSTDFSFMGSNVSTGIVRTIALQTDGKILVGDDYLRRFNADGSADDLFSNLISDYGINSIALQVDGKIWVGGFFYTIGGIVKRGLALINSDGFLNTYQNDKGGNSTINFIVQQKNGKTLVGGEFSSFNGILISGLVRLNLDGSIDHTFNIGYGASGSVYSIIPQPDGKILVGGSFTSFNSIPQRYLIRLNADGSVDNTFNIGTGFDGSIRSMVLQSDGKILAGGFFTNLNGASQRHFVRLNYDGTVDNTFNIGSGANGDVLSIAIQNNGKILIAGNFSSFNGASQNNLVRLNEDGSLDNTFNIGMGANDAVNSIAIQPDGKILAGGSFTTFNGIGKSSLVRLNENGSLDYTLNIGSGANGFILSIALQVDGKILAGRSFTTFNGEVQNYFTCLNTNGSIDNTFNMELGFNSYVNNICLQQDGKILAGGSFDNYNNIPYNFIIRLHGDPFYLNSIRGNIYTDSNHDCKFQHSEKPIQAIIVKAFPGPFYGGSNAFGDYQLRVDSGAVNYMISQELSSVSSKLLINQCTPSYNISLTGSSKDTSGFDFADSTKQCYLLDISIQAPRKRRCFKSNTFVNYCNYGNVVASGVQIKVVYPSYIIPLQSVPMWTSKQDSVLIYDVGTVQKVYCGGITITDSIICGNESIRGLTQCIKATISPASNCVAEDFNWDRSSMKVTGNCVNGSSHFTVTNEGTGNMGSSLEYRVYENDTLIYTGTYKLNSGESFNVDYPAEGNTIRLEADQSPFHPGQSRPRATIEDCGMPTEMRNLVTTAPLDDLDEEVSIICNTIVDSYDPNDKQATPTGIGSTNRISPGQEIEYSIRFQNTGSDTAYNVRVVDTLDIALDPGSFIQGVSSHPYALNVSGKGQAVLSFLFTDINLPDSTTNNLMSNGLVSFRITVPSGTSSGTVIKNKAHIFFDYNSAIITNETMHTIDATVDSDLSRGSAVQVGQTIITGVSLKYNESVKIYPNPTAGIITMEMPTYGSNMEMRVFSVIGVLHKSVSLNKSLIQQVNLEGMQQGMYIYEIWQDGMRKAGGKLEVR